MAARGQPKSGGREKGTPNKITLDLREFYLEFLQKNAWRMQECWDKVAARNPAQALHILNGLTEYVLPKLQRTELTGKDGEEFTLQLDFTNFVKKMEPRNTKQIENCKIH